LVESAKPLRLGTRASLLAVGQSELILEQLKKFTDRPIELVKITTEGDQKTEKPLWQMDGKDFFTKELDQALLAREIDFVVHSYKDLGSERPAGIKLAAITERKYAHDVLLVKNETVKNINEKKTFVVGTSSPRRIVNIKSSLLDYLPKGPREIELKNLRGNVNTRITKLREGQYDAIVLAMAGLERLATHPRTCVELKKLLEGLNFMILPQSVFPSAASQGALGLECHEENHEMLALLKNLDHQITREEVSLERKHFQSYGGGCHLAMGINAIKSGETLLLHQRGEVDGKTIHQRDFSETPGKNQKAQTGFVGMISQKEEKAMIYDGLIKKTPYVAKQKLHSHLFATSRYCIPTLKENSFETLWSSGAKTSRVLAKEGFWVNGSADSLGHEQIQRFRESRFCQFFTKNEPFSVMTHKESVSLVGDVVGCYEREIIQDVKEDEDYKKSLQATDAFFWSSYPQYELYLESFPFLKDKIHCCGLGKTLEQFEEKGIDVLSFYSVTEFKQWILKDEL
jgi:hydroxymethylbilane synthase